MKQDSRFVMTCFRITDLIIINVLFWICCLPVITIGASVTGLYYTTMKMVKDEETAPISKDFFSSFRRNFKQATLVWLGMLLFGGFLYVDFRIAGTIESVAFRSLMVGFLLAILVIYLCISAYVYPLIARFENTTGNMIKNSMHMSAMKVFYTIPMIILNLSPLLVLFVPGEMIKWCLALYCFIWFSAVAYLNSKMLVAIFDKIQ